VVPLGHQQLVQPRGRQSLLATRPPHGVDQHRLHPRGDRVPHRSRPRRSHEDTRELYALALRFFGFETMTEDGAGALDRVRETHPDIIVKDIALPRCDGWTFVDELKHDPQTSAIPVVVLTSYMEPSLRARAEREGCAAVLTKPLRPKGGNCVTRRRVRTLGVPLV
jgi:CheY-like chemotaxis protein